MAAKRRKHHMIPPPGRPSLLYNLREVPNMLTVTRRALGISFIALLILDVAPHAQNRTAPKITSPKEQFGWEVGDDYRLVNYTQYEQYLKKIDRESDRLSVVEIGKTAEGRTE